MPYRYVSQQDLGFIEQDLRRKGYDDQDIPEISKRIADDLEEKRYRQNAPSNVVGAFVAGTSANAPQVLSESLRGTTAYTPGQGGIDPLLLRGAGRLNEAVYPPAAALSAERASGPRWGPGMGMTWASLLGQQMPVMGQSLVGSALAGIPTALLTRNTKATQVAAEVGGGVSMALMETGGFLSATDVLGLDQDIAEGNARLYGPISGAIEQSQIFGLLSPYKGGQKVASRGVIQAILRMMGKELGVATLEGMEEVGQGMAFNAILDKAVVEQNARNEKQGLPPVDPNVVAQLKQDLEEGFEAGFGVALIMRAPARLRTGGSKFMIAEAKRRAGEAATSVVKKRGPEIEKQIAEGASVEEVAGTKRLAPPRVAPIGTPAAEREARKPLTDRQKLERLDELTPNRRRHLAKVLQIPTVVEGKVLTDAEIRQRIAERIEAVKEGPVEEPTGQFRLKTRKPESKDVVFRGWQEGAEGQAPLALYNLKHAAGDKPKNGTVTRETAESLGLEVPEPPPRGARGIVEKTPVKRVRVIKPILNPVLAPERAHGEALDVFLRQIVRAVRGNLSQWFPQYANTINQANDEREARRGIVNALRWMALQPVIGETRANALLPLNETDLGKPPFLSEKLTRDDYAQYRVNLEGLVREQLRTMGGKQAENTVIAGIAQNMDVQLDEKLHIASVPLAEGKSLDHTQLAESGHLPWWRRFAALLPSLEALSERLKLPLMQMDATLFNGYKIVQKVYMAFRIAERYAWLQVPKQLHKGKAGLRMAELLNWVLSDRKNKDELAHHLKVSETYRTVMVGEEPVRLNKDLLSKVMAESGLDENAVAKAVLLLQGKYRSLYNWFYRNHLIPPDKFHRDYAPIIRLYAAEKTDMRLEEWVRANRKARAELKHLSESDIQSIGDIADTISSWQRKGYGAPASSPGFMEYARAQDRAFIELMNRITDIRELTDIYIRKGIQRLVFRDMVPAVAALVRKANKVTSGRDRDVVNKVFRNYFESLMGVPDTAGLIMRNMDLLAMLRKTGGVPVLGSFVRAGSKLMHAMNKVPFLPKLELTEESTFTAEEALDLGITYLYASTLGLPFNITSPIKNLTQMTLAVQAVGLPRFLRGLTLLSHEDTLKEIQAMNLRHEFPGVELAQLGARRGHWARAAQFMLLVYRMSDAMNVYATAASGLVGWRQLDFSKSKTLDHMTDRDIIAALFSKRIKGLDDKKVMAKPLGGRERAMWKGVISKPVALEVVDLIRRGDADTAKQMYEQYLVNLTQWRYGPGGTPGFLRNSVMRALFMYTTWPTNYGDFFFGKMMRRNMVARTAQTLTAQWVVASLLTGLGYKAWNWFLAGPFPDEMFPMGPLGQLAENLWRILRGSAVGITGELIPGVPEEERARNRQAVQRQIDDLLG